MPQNTNLPDDYDFVIEFIYNSNGWCRKYKSGWVEQCIKITPSGSVVSEQVEFITPMANTDYSFAKSIEGNNTDTMMYRYMGVWNKTKTSVTTYKNSNFVQYLEIKGMGQPV